MPTRQRIRTSIRKVGGGGGGGPAPGGTISWGPSFGQSEGEDESTWNATGSVDLDKLGLIGNLTSNGAVDLDHLAVDYNTMTATGAVDLDQIGVSGGVVSIADVAMTNIGVEGHVTSGPSITLPHIAIDSESIVCNSSVDLDAIGVSGGAVASGVLTGEVYIQGIRPSEDTYLSESEGTTAYGTADEILSRTPNALGNAEQHAYMAWDFTNFGSGSSSSAIIYVTGETTAAFAESANVQVYTHPTKPFEEDTATWDNSEPPVGTLRETISVSWPVTADRRTITLTSATLPHIAGNWLYLRFNGAAILGVQSIIVRSKEWAVGAAITDETGNYGATITGSGAAVVSSDFSGFNGKITFPDGTYASVTTSAFNIAAYPRFTIECRVGAITAGAGNVDGYQAFAGLFDVASSSLAVESWGLSYNDNNALRAVQFAWRDSGGITRTVRSLNANDGSAHSWAVDFDGTTVRLYKDGVVAASNTANATFETATTNILQIGGAEAAGNQNASALAGVDELRISNIARYAGAYTPTTSPFTADGSTVALYHMDAIVADTSDAPSLDIRISI